MGDRYIETEYCNSDYSPITDTREYFIEKFPFLDRFQLVAVVERKPKIVKFDNSKREYPHIFQMVGFEFLSKEGKVLDGEKMLCIHTVVATTTLEELESIPPDLTKEDYFLNGISTEHIEEIHLNPKEHFFALKSWVQGISEAGRDLFTDFDTYLEYPAYHRAIIPLFHLVVRHDQSFLPEYLTFVQRKCQFEGKWHNTNLIMLLKPAFIFTQDEIRHKKYIDMMLAMDFPFEVCCEFLPYSVIKRNFSDVPNYEEVVFKHYQLDLAQDRDAVKYKSFRKLFLDKDYFIQKLILKNQPSAHTYPEFRNLFKHPNSEVREALARHPEAAKFPEFRKFFSDPDLGVKMWALTNDKAIDLPEYKQILDEMVADPKSQYWYYPYIHYINMNIVLFDKLGDDPKFSKIFDRERRISLSRSSRSL